MSCFVSSQKTMAHFYSTLQLLPQNCICNIPKPLLTVNRAWYI